MKIFEYQGISRRNIMAAAVVSALWSSAGYAQVAGEQRIPAARGIEEIVVTARRREEGAQATPMALAVLDSAAIEKSGLKELRDLNASVPGINMSSSGSAVNTIFSIRGISRASFGPVQPAVTTYVNDVPLSSWGASLPTYDMASLQVLKGPQGTLFGRNSTTGAVVATTQVPSHEFGGFVSATFGNYDAQLYEVGIDVPVVKDKIALRFAGQLDKRDGYTRDMVYGVDLDNADRENFRISLLLEPSEDLRNVTVYERINDNSEMAGTVPWRSGPGLVDTLPFTNGTLPGCNGDPTCDFNALISRQESGGIRKVWPSVLSTISLDRTFLSNTTTWEIGGVTIKNIYGQAEVNIDTFNDNDGAQMTLVTASTQYNAKQVTNEFQVLGEALDGNLEYIAGYFYLDSEPNGINKLGLQTFKPFGVPVDDPVNGIRGAEIYYYDESRAWFGQVSYDLSHLNDTLAGFSVDMGLRKTKDKAGLCSTPASSFGQEVGEGAACSSVLQGASQLSQSFSKETFMLGMNYRPIDDLLLYVLGRTGYRAGGLNAPAFGGQLVPFQSFGPESTREIEVGLKSDWQLGDVFGRFNLALFESEIDGLQGPFSVSGVADPDGDGDPNNNPVSTNIFTNIGEATIRGVEFELVVQPLSNLELSVAGAWLDRSLDKLSLTHADLPSTLPPSALSADVVEGSAFLGSPDYSYTLGINYRLPMPMEYGELEFSTRYHKMSSISYQAIEAAGYEMTDFRISWYGAMSTGFDAALFIKNAFDEEALVGPSGSAPGIGTLSGLYSAPRMYGVTLKYSF